MGRARRGWFVELCGVESKREGRTNAFIEFLTEAKAKGTMLVDFGLHKRRIVKGTGVQRSAPKAG